ncbi:hypothetical protein [Streptomyces sp. NRRL S-337]|uniref:hypothetical protein n=1 Tax=Streptomyces sp. NRRL S-337 TaxID=1463900 RepID=UPI0004CBF416
MRGRLGCRQESGAQPSGLGPEGQCGDEAPLVGDAAGRDVGQWVHTSTTAGTSATGLRPRRLPFGHDLAGVHVLRALDDTLTLRAQLLAGPRWW